MLLFGSHTKPCLHAGLKPLDDLVSPARPGHGPHDFVEMLPGGCGNILLVQPLTETLDLLREIHLLAFEALE